MFTCAPAVIGGNNSYVGPLDPYPGYWGVFGVAKRLVSGTGPLIRVVSSAGGNPAFDIAFNTSAELSAALTTLLGGNSGFVSDLYDHGGSGNKLTQPTLSKMPRIYNAGTFDGKVVFDGVDDCLQSNNASGTPTAFSAFIKGKMRSTVTTTIILEQGASFPSAAHNQFLYYDIGTSQASVASSEGASNYIQNIFAYLLNNDVHAPISDRTQLTSLLQNLLFVAGVQRLRSATSNLGSLPTGNFTAELWNVGARNNGSSLAAPLDLYSLVIYESNEAVDAPAISGILA